jgi:peroxiredoxin
MVGEAVRMSAMDEDEFYPKTLQEELNEITEAFYAAHSDEVIRQYQLFVENITKQSIAEGAIKSPTMAPNFELEDQDGDMVCLRELLERGPVVLVFYRGKWCPHCNATLMRLQRELSKIEAKGASLVAISPMLPDGTQYLASKRSLQFLVCSDLGNSVAKSFKITFQVMPELREAFLKLGEDIPAHNGDETWEIPLPATFVIDQSGEIVWSFIDDDPSIRADIDDIVAAIPPKTNLHEESEVIRARAKEIRARVLPARVLLRNEEILQAPSTFKKNLKTAFGKLKQTPMDFLGNYILGK